MSLTWELEPGVERALRRQAERVGMNPEDYAAGIVRRNVESSTPSGWVANRE